MRTIVFLFGPQHLRYAAGYGAAAGLKAPPWNGSRITCP